MATCGHLLENFGHFLFQLSSHWNQRNNDFPNVENKWSTVFFLYRQTLELVRWFFLCFDKSHLIFNPDLTSLIKLVVDQSILKDSTVGCSCPPYLSVQRNGLSWTKQNLHNHQEQKNPPFFQSSVQRSRFHIFVTSSWTQCDKQIRNAEIAHSDRLKVVMWLGTSNQRTLNQPLCYPKICSWHWDQPAGRKLTFLLQRYHIHRTYSLQKVYDYTSSILGNGIKITSSLTSRMDCVKRTRRLH